MKPLVIRRVSGVVVVVESVVELGEVSDGVGNGKIAKFCEI